MVLILLLLSFLANASAFEITLQLHFSRFQLMIFFHSLWKIEWSLNLNSSILNVSISRLFNNSIIRNSNIKCLLILSFIDTSSSFSLRFNFKSYRFLSMIGSFNFSIFSAYHYSRIINQIFLIFSSFLDTAFSIPFLFIKLSFDYKSLSFLWVLLLFKTL